MSQLHSVTVLRHSHVRSVTTGERTVRASATAGLGAPGPLRPRPRARGRVQPKAAGLCWGGAALSSSPLPPFHFLFSELEKESMEGSRL